MTARFNRAYKAVPLIHLLHLDLSLVFNVQQAKFHQSVGRGPE